MSCTAGQFVTGGGFLVGSDYLVDRSQPNGNTGWRVVVANPFGAPQGVAIEAYAICAASS